MGSMRSILAAASVFILFAALFGCASQGAPGQGSQAPMVELENQSKLGDLIATKTAAKGDTVGVYYIGKLENGTLFDTNVRGRRKKQAFRSAPAIPCSLSRWAQAR